MPKESLSLYFSIQDGGSSSVLTSLTDKTKALDKETQSLAQAAAALKQANAPLLQQQNDLKTQLEKSGLAVKDARKEYQQYGDELHETKLSEAIAEHDELRQKLKDTEDQLKANQKTYNEYREDIRKGGLQDGGSQSDGISSLAQGLATSAVGSMLASSFGGFTSTLLTSAIGTSQASLISDTLSSALSGATAGAVAGLPGIIIGGLLGAGSGALSGYTAIYQEKDDAFKEYYNSLIDSYSGLAAQRVASGSAIAAGRETDLISFSTMFGSRDAAEEYLSNLVDMSNRTPFLYDDLTSMSKTLATYGYDETSILPVLQTIGDAGAALGQSTSDMTSVATAIGRMVSSDKASLEYLNILNDRGINAVGYLAEARGVSIAQTYEDISKGNIKGTEAAEIILAAMEESYAGSMEAQSKTFAGLTSTLEGWQQEIENAAGEGYNTLRTQGLNAEIDSLGGALGDAMREINTIIGENQARGENLQELYQREAVSAVLLGENSGLFTDKDQATLDEWAAMYDAAAERYAAGEEKAGLEMQALYENAQMLGQAAYDSSEWAQAEVDVQLEQIEAIRENTAGLAAATDAFRIAQEESKGLGATEYEQKKLADKTEAFIEAMAQPQMEPAADIFGALGEWVGNTIRGSSHAYGLDRVPYDDYPALLHEGERVLTASEARAMDGDGGAPIVQLTITGNNFVGTGEEMADQIAEILVRKLEQADIIHQPG